MKKNAIAVSVAVVLGVALGALGTMYLTQWREPAATYEPTEDMKLTEVRESLDDYISDLRARGEYRCCIKDECKWCAIYMGHCPCMDLVMEEGMEKSCPECAAAWNRKQGKIPGVDPDAIQVTTFGIYGYEKGGHHSSEEGRDDESGHGGGHAESRSDEKAHQEVEEHHGH